MRTVGRLAELDAGSEMENCPFAGKPSGLQAAGSVWKNTINKFNEHLEVQKHQSSTTEHQKNKIDGNKDIIMWE